MTSSLVLKPLWDNGRCTYAARFRQMSKEEKLEVEQLADDAGFTRADDIWTPPSSGKGMTTFRRALSEAGYALEYDGRLSQCLRNDSHLSQAFAGILGTLMAIEIKFSGKNDKVGKCVVTVGGITKETGPGSDGFADALIEIDMFEKHLEDKAELRHAFEEMIRKSTDECTVALSEADSLIDLSEPDIATGLYRYVAHLDGELIYSGNSLFDFRIEVSNIPEPSIGP